jgi:hypothetical protein
MVLDCPLRVAIGLSFRIKPMSCLGQRSAARRVRVFQAGQAAGLTGRVYPSTINIADRALRDPTHAEMAYDIRCRTMYDCWNPIAKMMS